MPSEKTDRWARFQLKLEETHTWPEPYTFKFIVPSSQAEMVYELFADTEQVAVRRSRKGNYLCVTACIQATCSQEVISFYRAAEYIPGLISL
jgi:hypothetical protein